MTAADRAVSILRAGLQKPVAAPKRIPRTCENCDAFTRNAAGDIAGRCYHVPGVTTYESDTCTGWHAKAAKPVPSLRRIADEIHSRPLPDVDDMTFVELRNELFGYGWDALQLAQLKNWTSLADKVREVRNGGGVK